MLKKSDIRSSIADNMAILLKENRRSSVWYGDIDLLEKCAVMSGLPKSHPKKTIQRVLNALDRSHNFTKGYIYADFSGTNRKYRCFTIKEEK